MDIIRINGSSRAHNTRSVTVDSNNNKVLYQYLKTTLKKQKLKVLILTYTHIDKY